MNKNGDFYVLHDTRYECEDERAYGSSGMPPMATDLFMNFFATEIIGASVINTEALAKLEFRHER